VVLRAAPRASENEELAARESSAQERRAPIRRFTAARSAHVAPFRSADGVCRPRRQGTTRRPVTALTGRPTTSGRSSRANSRIREKDPNMLWTILIIVLIVLVVMAIFGRGRFSR
jgi:hypothetical protein